jgi:hypothetical protein
MNLTTPLEIEGFKISGISRQVFPCYLNSTTLKWGNGDQNVIPAKAVIQIMECGCRINQFRHDSLLSI